MLRILATSSLVQVGQDLYQFYIPVHGHGIGLSASAIGGLLATFAAASFVVRIFLPAAGRALRRREECCAFVLSSSAAGFGLAPFFESVAVLAVVSFIFGLGMGCGQPITTMLIFSRSARGRSGEILGLRQSVNNALRVSGAGRIRVRRDGVRVAAGILVERADDGRRRIARPSREKRPG